MWQLLTQALGCHAENVLVIGAVANCVTVLAEFKPSVPFLCSAGTATALLGVLDTGTLELDGTPGLVICSSDGGVSWCGDLS